MTLEEEYRSLMHKVQTGVAMQLAMEETGQHQNISGCGRKHMRTGVNSAMVDTAAIVKTLIDKGFCTGDEFYANLVWSARREVERYEVELTRQKGYKVTLA